MLAVARDDAAVGTEQHQSVVISLFALRIRFDHRQCEVNFQVAAELPEFARGGTRHPLGDLFDGAFGVRHFNAVVELAPLDIADGIHVTLQGALRKDDDPRAARSRGLYQFGEPLAIVPDFAHLRRALNRRDADGLWRAGIV